MSGARDLVRAVQLCPDRFGRVVPVALALMALLAAGSPSASLARPAAVSHPKLSFRALGNASALSYNERYVLVTQALAPVGDLGTLYDDAARTSQALTRPGCTPAGSPPYPRIGGPLLFECGPGAPAAPELYFPASRRWQSVVLNPAISNPCASVPDPSMCDVNSAPLQAGSRWLEASEANCPDDEHCSTSLIYQNLQSGLVATDPSRPGGPYTADLNATRLAQRLCSPLRVPLSEGLFSGAGAGEITKLGRFAISIATDTHGITGAYLERCGSRLHEFLTARQDGGDALLAATSNMIAWLGGRATLSLESLPSRDRATIPLRCCGLPSASVTQIAVTDRRVYLLTSDERLLAAVLPRTLTPRKGTVSGT